MAEFRMPSLGADMEAGTLVEWLVKPGDPVRRGQIVAVVDTEKAAIEVECFATGVVERLLVTPGTRVPVGAPLALIAEREAPVPAAPVEAPAERAAAPPPSVALPPSPPAPAPPAGPPVSSPLVRHLAARKGVDLAAVRGSGPAGAVTRADVERVAGRVRTSPLARKLARELGVDLARVVGTGADGAIRADDVRRAAAAAPPAPPVAAEETEKAETPEGAERALPERVVEETPPEKAAPATAEDRQLAMRQAIARLMARSKREIPHYYLTQTIDFAAASTWLRARNRELAVPDRLVPAALLLKAAARAAREVAQLNGFWIDDHFVASEHVHLGVAISLRGGGLVAPALHDADTLELTELMRRLRDLVARTRAGRLRGAEMADPTITVTNLGEQGVESVHGVIYPPQVALVGFGKVVSRPWAVDGLLGVRPIVVATLAGDHRASDGYTGARYLDAVTRLLQHPEDL